MTLQQYILENIDKNSLINLIKNCNDETKLKKIGRILNSENPESLDQWFIDRGLSDIKNTIIRTIEEYGEIDEFFKIVRGETQLPSSLDFLKDNNIYNLLKEIGLTQKCLKDINSLRVNLDSTAVGAFEILCDMFLSDAKHVKTNKKRKSEDKEEQLESGDVMTSNGAIELKTSGAAVKGHSINSAANIDIAFEKIMNDRKYVDRYDSNNIIKSIHKAGGKNQSYFGSQTSIINTLRMLSEHGYTVDDVNDILSNCLMAQFNPTSSEIKEFKNLLDKNKDVFFPSSLLFSHKMSHSKYKKSRELTSYNFDEYKFASLFGIIDIYFYHKYENWRYITVFKDNDSGIYRTIKGDDCSSFDNILSLVEQGELRFKSSKIPFGTERSAAAAIIY